MFGECVDMYAFVISYTIICICVPFSQLPTTAIDYYSPNPSCEYTVRRDGPNGPLVGFANVGDTVRYITL